MPEPKKDQFARYTPPGVPIYTVAEDILLAAATLSEGGLGKIGTIPASGTLILRCDCSDRYVPKLDWLVKIDKAWTYQLYWSAVNVQQATITFADATPIDDGDGITLNGKALIAEATEGDADPAAGKYWTGVDNAAAAANLTALINSAAYGVPGVTATVAAVAATDVITVKTTTAPVLQFALAGGAQAADANEAAWAETTLASLREDGVALSKAAVTTTSGFTIPQWVDGRPQAYLVLTNNDGALAATPSVRRIRY